MNKFSLLPTLLLASVLALSACNRTQPTTQASPSAATPTPSASASTAPASPSPAAEVSPSVSPAAIAQTYREKDGLFEVSFPEGYTYQDTGSGIAFASSDQTFGGSVDFGAANGNKLNNSQLEASLKKEYESRLEKVEWQGSKEQPDGSIRVDWVGRDKQGNNLDAVSFVEQRGDYVFILNLFAVNKDYQSFSADAEAIVGSYKVKKN